MCPLPFNIFLCDLFLSTESNYFTNYTDDTTLYVIGNDVEEVIPELKIIAKELFVWFAQIVMKGNFDKSHLLLSTTNTFNSQISETITHNLHSGKSCWDKILKFEIHIENLMLWQE